MNQEQKYFCETRNLTKDQFFGKEKINGYLDLSSVKSIPEGFNPIVGGYLDLRSVKSIPEGFNPIVGGNLDLQSVRHIPEGFNPIVGRDLYLESVKSIPEGFNPIVGGSLDLRSVTSIHVGFNPTVGGNLILHSVKSIPEGFNPIIGWRLVLSSGRSQNKRPCPSMLSWQDGKYIKVDGLFTEVVSKKKNVWKVKKLNQDTIFCLVTDGNENYAHGDSIKDAFLKLPFVGQVFWNRE